MSSRTAGFGYQYNSRAAGAGYRYSSRTQELAARCRRTAAIRRQRNRKIRFVSLLITCVITGLLIGLFAAPSVKLTAAANHDTQILYRSVYVSEGDTLSSLEKEYNTESTLSRKAYISRVKSINHINDNNTIHAGGYITIPYYSAVED